MRALFVAASLLLLALPAAAEKIYRGEQTLWQDTVWEGEVLIDGILTVAPGTELRILPGTRIRFTFFDSNGDGIGEHELFIQGELQAEGTAGAPIVFTSAERRAFAGAWGAINMMMSETPNRLDHCIFEYAYRGFHAHFSQATISNCLFRGNLRGMQFQESTVNIRDCRILDNRNGIQFRNSRVVIDETIIAGGFWGLRCVYADLSLTNCLIRDNLINGANLRDSKVRAQGNRIIENRRGLYLQRTEGDIRGNWIEANSEHGIFLEESKVAIENNLVRGNGRSAIRWLDSQGEVRGNDFSLNGTYAVINDGKTTMNAAGNWWGSVAPDAVGRLVRDISDRDDCGRVLWSPVLAKRPQLTIDN